MKQQTAISIKVPQGAEVIEKGKELDDFSSSWDLLGTNAKMVTSSILMTSPVGISGGIAGTMAGFENFGPLTTIAFGMSMLVAGILQLLEVSDFRETSSRIKKANAPIEAYKNDRLTQSYSVPDRYSYSSSSDSNGYTVSKKTRNWVIYNPLRLVKRMLVNETTWYNPETDIHTIQRTYANAFKMYTEVERLGGPRYSFRRALNSL